MERSITKSSIWLKINGGEQQPSNKIHALLKLLYLKEKATDI